MFRKPFSVKSNTNIRSSDRRKLLDRFPVSSEIPSKSSSFSLARVVAFNGVHLNVYSCDNDPYFFEFQDDRSIYPTVYFSWVCPTSAPVLLVDPSVMEFIQNGADLMLPGVHLPSKYLLPEFEKDVAVLVAVYYQDTDSFSPIAVGSSVLSSASMVTSGMKGKGVNILHIYQDHLWEFGSKSKPPQIPLDTVYRLKDAPVGDTPDPEQLTVDDERDPQPNVEQQRIQDEPQDNSTENMDDLLTSVFFWTLKENSSSINLPMDCGQFYANYILKPLPPDVKIDLKKTTFKKFGVFLKKIDETGLIKIVTKRGLDSIHEINFDSDLIKNAERPFEVVEEAEKPSIARVWVSEGLSVTEAVLPLLRLYGCKKGDVLQSNQLREMVVLYGASRNLLTEDKKKIELDDILQTLCRRFFPDKVGVNELAQKMEKQMTKAFVVTLPDGKTNIRRDRIPPIEFKTEKRSGHKIVTTSGAFPGELIKTRIFFHSLHARSSFEKPPKLGHSRQVNKQASSVSRRIFNACRFDSVLANQNSPQRLKNLGVTLINNTAIYGIDVNALSKRIQIALATGTSINQEAACCEGPQILLQGNHVFFLGELLQNEYGVQKKYIKGLELGVKPKKTKNKC